MSLLDEFVRVTARWPCPVCQRPDWCLVSRDSQNDPSQVICARVESRRRFGQAGWLHSLREDCKRWTGVHHRSVRLPSGAVGVALAALAERFRANLADQPLGVLARDLVLSIESLERLGVGWTGSSWSWPMLDAAGRVVGISLRRLDGGKYAVKGSHQGLFVPVGLVPGRRLLICEGQSDTAACLDLEFDAIGRAGARSAIRIVCEAVRRLHPSEVIVVGDRDAVGTSGAEELTSALAVTGSSVRTVLPPEGVKDVREWKVRGATAADLEAAIAAAPAARLQVRVSRVDERT